jgi:hypothetical protein
MEFTIAPTPWTICAEIFPNRIRAICISLTTGKKKNTDKVI